MALHCPFCNSVDVQTLIGDNTQCVNCGKMFNSAGDAVNGMDANTRAVLEQALEPRQTNVVGNLADLQRAGAAIAAGTGSTLADGVETPAGVDPDDLTATDTTAKGDKATAKSKK